MTEVTTAPPLGSIFFLSVIVTRLSLRVFVAAMCRASRKAVISIRSQLLFTNRPCVVVLQHVREGELS